MPTIVLPSGWRSWDLDKLRSVLLHEQAHAQRRDPLARLIVGLVSCPDCSHEFEVDLSQVQDGPPGK